MYLPGVAECQYLSDQVKFFRTCLCPVVKEQHTHGGKLFTICHHMVRLIEFPYVWYWHIYSTYTKNLKYCKVKYVLFTAKYINTTNTEIKWIWPHAVFLVVNMLFIWLCVFLNYWYLATLGEENLLYWSIYWFSTYFTLSFETIKYIFFL